MHPAEVEQALTSMVCLVDTREQDTPLLRARLNRIGVPCIRQKLLSGDYSAKFQLPDNSWYQVKVAIERKMNITELCGCYCQQRERYEKEFIRAAEANIKLYMLIEDATWENIYAGRYMSRMRSSALVASIMTWLARFNCCLIFCKAETSGKLIHDILYYEAREQLLRMEELNDGSYCRQ